ncbi:MAG: winged helix-turn-helix domain-containing protein, partial [Planctomycetes bacterium]|nr:winged helix-turn-helix domain-containing protein [Planctomycetota bacterium]
THQELADLVGTNRETVSHKIAEFRREGSLGVTVNKRFVILNEEVLRAWMR